jgi:hypothetical protein
MMADAGGKGAFAKGFLLPKPKPPAKLAATAQPAAKPPPEAPSRSHEEAHSKEEHVKHARSEAEGSRLDAPLEEISPEKRAKLEGRLGGENLEGEEMEVEGSPGDNEASTSQGPASSSAPSKPSFGTRRKPVVIIVIGMAGRS